SHPTFLICYRNYHSLYIRIRIYLLAETTLGQLNPVHIGRSPASPITSGHSSSLKLDSSPPSSSDGSVLRESLITSASSYIGQSKRSARAIASICLESSTKRLPSLMRISITAIKVLSRRLVTTTRST